MKPQKTKEELFNRRKDFVEYLYNVNEKKDRAISLLEPLTLVAPKFDEQAVWNVLRKATKTSVMLEFGKEKSEDEKNKNPIIPIYESMIKLCGYHSFVDVQPKGGEVMFTQEDMDILENIKNYTIPLWTRDSLIENDPLEYFDCCKLMIFHNGKEITDDVFEQPSVVAFVNVNEGSTFGHVGYVSNNRIHLIVSFIDGFFEIEQFGFKLQRFVSKNKLSNILYKLLYADNLPKPQTDDDEQKQEDH